MLVEALELLELKLFDALVVLRSRAKSKKRVFDPFFVSSLCHLLVNIHALL